MFCIFRLVVLSLRAQSLLNLKLYKMKRHELKDYQKTIQDVLAKSEEDPSTSSEGQSRTEQMSTPSPAGSEGSNCSKVREQIFFMFDEIFLLFPVSVQRLLLQRGEPAAGCADPAHCPAHLPVHPPQRDAEPVQLLQLPQPVS